jgi:tetratricopeptide (TPR) repeat protein
MTTRSFYICVSLVLPLCAQVPICPGSPASSEVSQGLTAYREASYAVAAEHLQVATQLDPGCANALLYLGNSYMHQYVPGVAAAENQAFAEKAREQYQKLLDEQPENKEALESIASLYFSQKKLDDAQVWYEKLAVVDSDSKVAFYSMGVIAWTRSFQADKDARAKSGMQPEDPGPLKDAAERHAVREKYLTMVQEGIDHLNRAVEIDVEYDDAMAYLNLLYREKADFENTPGEYQADIAKAVEWVQKAQEIKKERSKPQ